MDTKIKEVIFESPDNSPKTTVDVPEEIQEEHKEIMHELLHSGYVKYNNICIDRFLDEDRTIDLEKLELAVMLLVEFQEFSDKSEEPIYVILDNMEQYFTLRHIASDNLERIAEESSFILGFCGAIAEEETINRRVIVMFAKHD